MILLEWNILAKEIKKKLIDLKPAIFPDPNVYLAILLFDWNKASETYVKLKEKYAADIWIQAKVFRWPIETFTDAIELIKTLNNDPLCIWIVPQLPFSRPLSINKQLIIDSIDPSKDVDWLWVVITWQNQLWITDFLPATVRWIFSLLDYYNLWDIKGKKVVIIWQSNLIGKPLAIQCLKLWAEVIAFDINDHSDTIIQHCQNAEYIFSCTGDLNFVKKNFTREDGNQVIIDAWYWFIEWKAVWDVDFDGVAPYVKAITPVPGGVWPLTVASLFSNLFDLHIHHWWHQFSPQISL